MPSIDQRVVQMVFDKGNFESAVQSVIKTLDNLKKNLKLDKASDEFNKITAASKDVDLSSLANGVDTIASRFSNMGIIGMSVLNNLTNTAVNAGKRLLGAITSPLIEGGKRRALNIEQAKFQIEGLGYTWEQVYDDIDYAVTGTAYGLDAAAKAAGQLLASSVEVGPSMKSALRGISGVAAMTNSEYDDIANVFTTVAGNGRLMASELNRLSARGINAAATLGKYLNKSEAEVREMTSKGQIDFNTFAAAMDSAFGEHAKDANKTFTGALSNMKAALSRIGAEFATPAYQHMRDILNSLRLVVNEVKAAIAPLVESATGGMAVVADYLNWVFKRMTNAFKSGVMEKPMEQLNRIVVALGTSVWNLYRDVRNILYPIGQAFAQAFGGTLLDVLARAAEGIERFTRSLNLNERMQENLRKTFVGVFTILAAVLDIVASLTGLVAGGLSSALVRVFGFFVDILLRITGFVGDVVVKVKEFVDAVLQLEFVQWVMKSISDLFENVGKVIGGALDGLQDFIYMLLDNAFNGAIGGLEALGEAFKNVGDWIRFAYDRIVEWVKYVYELPIVQGTIERVSEAFNTLREHVSKVVSVVKSSLISAFTKAKDAISKFMGTLKELVGQYVEIPSLQEGIAQFQQFVVDAFNNSKDIFEFVSTVVRDIVDRIKELTGVSFQKVLDNFANLRDRIGEVIGQVNTLEDVKGALRRVGDFFGEFADNTGGFIQQVKDNILKFVDWVKTKVSGITLGELIAAGTAGSFMAFFLSMASFINKAKKIVVDWTSFVDEFAKIPKNVNKILKNFAERTAYDKVKERIGAISDLVKSLALLSGALILLAGVDPVRLVTAAAVLGGLMTLMAGLASFMASNPGINGKHAKNSIMDLGTMMLALAGSLAVLAVALRIIGNMNAADIAKGIIAIGFALGELVAASIILGRYSKEVAVGTGTILALAGSMLMMSGAIALLGLIPVENLAKAITAIGVMLTVTAIAARIASTGDKGSFRTIMGLALAMIGMVMAMKMLAGMSTGDFISGLMRMVVAVGVMTLLFKAASLAGPYAAKAGGSIALMSSSFILLAAAFKLLSSISTTDIAKGIQTLGAVTIIFGMMAAITRLAGKNGKSAGLAIIAMSGALILIAAAIAILAQIDPAGLQRATDAVEGLIFMFAVLVASTSLAGQATRTVTILAIAIGALAGALAILSLIEPANLLAATLAIDSVIACFSLLVASSGMAGKAYGTVILMTIVVGALGGMLALLAQVNPEGSLQVALGLSSLLVALSVAMVVCGSVGAVAPAALAGIGIMAAVFAAIVGLISILGAINAATDGAFRYFLEDTIPVLQAIGEGIGTFFGSLVGGFLSSASNALKTVGDNLNTFMDSFLPFIESVKTIDESAIKGIDTLVTMVATLAAADFSNRITEILGGSSGSSLSALSEQLPKFGEALQKFSKSLGDTDTGSLEKAAQAGKALAEMVSVLPKEGGWLSGIFGKTDMAGFGDGLVDFGNALKNFGTAVDGANYDSINAAIEPTRSLIELGNMLPESGLIKHFTGMKDMGTFGQNLVEYGYSLKRFGKALGQGVDYDAISKVMQPTKDLIELAKTIDAIGGLGDAITGANDLGTFGANLATFGGTFKIFSENLGQIDPSSLDILPKVISAVQGLAEASKSLPTTGGALSFIFGDQGLGDFGEQLPKLGEGLAGFGTAMNGVNPDVISQSVPAIKALAEMADIIPATGGLFGWLSGNATAISDFGGQIGPLGRGLAVYGHYVSGLDVGGIQKSVPAVKALKEAVENMPGLFETLSGIITASLGYNGFPAIAAAIGAGIKAFSTELSGVDVGSAKDGAEAAKALSEAIQAMPSAFDVLGNVLAELTGNSFTDCCKKLAEGIKAFSENLDGVSMANVEKGVEAVNKIKDISQESGNFGNLNSVGEALKNFGEKFHQFYTKLTEGTDYGNLDKAFEYIDKLKGLMGEFSDEMSTKFGEAGEKISNSVNELVDSLKNSFNQNEGTLHDAAYNMANQVNTAIDEALSETSDKFNGVGEKLVATLVDSIRAGGDSVGQAILFIMNWALDTLNGKNDEFNNAGTSLINSLSDGMKSVGNNVQNVVENIIRDSYQKIVAYKARFQAIGRDLMSALGNGFRNGSSGLKSIVQSAINSAASGLSSSKFYSAGQSIAQGLADGMRSKIVSVTSAATALSNAARLASSSTLKINSPSKVFMKIGGYIAEGLAKGMTNSTNMVETKAIALANSAVDAMAIVSDTIENEINNMEYKPKITPVVDSRNLQEGIFGINSMFGPNYGLNMANNAFGLMGANAALMAQNQNGTYELMNMLSNKLDDLEDAVNYLGTNMKIEVPIKLDSKVVARGIAKPMNRELGTIYQRGGIT